MDLPSYTPVLYFGLGLISGVAGIFGYASWLQRQEAPPPPKARKWDTVQSLKFHYDYDVRVRSHTSMADLAQQLFITISKHVKDDPNFQSYDKPHEAVYTVVIDGVAHFTLRPATEELQGVPVLPDSKA